MSRPMVYEFNYAEQTEVFREMNDEEYAQCLIDQEQVGVSET